MSIGYTLLVPSENIAIADLVDVSFGLIKTNSQKNGSLIIADNMNGIKKYPNRNETSESSSYKST